MRCRSFWSAVGVVRALGLVLLLLTLAPLGSALAADLPQAGAPNVVQQVATDVGRLRQVLDTVEQAVARGDWDVARRQWREFGELWLDVEDPFRDLSRSGYTVIETDMVRVGDALRVTSPDVSVVRREIAALRSELQPFASGSIVPSGAPATSSGPEGLRDLMGTLDAALAATSAADAPTARTAVDTFQKQWLDVEGLVKTRSPAVYRSTEDGMAEAAALLKAEPPRMAEASAVLQRMHADLTPFAAEPLRYGVLDATIILLREGLEALVVVAALVAFLTKAGQRDKQRWVWGGAALGILASVLAAVLLQRIFSAATAGANRELVEGVIGLVAAGMLLYVSFWLHSKASISSWQGFVRGRTSAAIGGGSLVSLATISFLAVFREGAETVLFYAGIAPAIAFGDLMLGLGVGFGILAIVAIAMLRFGLQIPLRPFFRISSFLLYYLAFKFIGSGIHALQVAGAAPSTPIPVPSIELIGLYPTLETTLPQLVLLLGAAVVLLWSRAQDHTHVAGRTAASPSAGG